MKQHKDTFARKLKSIDIKHYYDEYGRNTVIPVFKKRLGTIEKSIVESYFKQMGWNVETIDVNLDASEKSYTALKLIDKVNPSVRIKDIEIILNG